MINWKLRLQNKATLTALVALLVAFIFELLGIFGVVPPISQDQVMQLVTLLITILAALGVVVDPTTDGIKDSERALGYECPHCDEAGE